MAQYRINVASFDVPDGWEDQSLTAFRIPAAAGGADASFVVTRDKGKGVKDFKVYIAEQVDLCRRNLPDFALLKSEHLSFQGRAAAWVEFTWAKDTTVMQLRQVFFDCAFEALICTLTCRPGDVAYFDPPWQKLMSSLVFDRPEAIAAFNPAHR
jgi:hypothetical protein